MIINFTLLHATKKIPYPPLLKNFSLKNAPPTLPYPTGQRLVKNGDFQKQIVNIFPCRPVAKIFHVSRLFEKSIYTCREIA